LEARAEHDAVVAERDHLQSQNVRLQHLLRQLQRAQFGPRSEKLDPDQLHLAFEGIEQKWQGAALEVVYFDEEPDEGIYSEGLTCTNEPAGSYICALRPCSG
jgi:hypothetical protein